MPEVDPKLTRYDRQVAMMLAQLRTKGQQILVTTKGSYVIKPTYDHRGRVIQRKIIE